MRRAARAAVRDEDCWRSLDCVVERRCSLGDHVCVAASDADCSSSLGCQVGRCVRQSLPLGSGGWCTAPGRPPPQSCAFDGFGADRCAQTGECLMSDDGVCETLASHGRRSPLLEDARRRIREAPPLERPVSKR